MHDKSALKHFCFKVQKKSFEVENECDLLHLNKDFVYFMHIIRSRALFVHDNDKAIKVLGPKSA